VNGSGAASKVPAAALWTVKLAGPPAVPPVIGGNRVYVALSSGSISAYDLKTGAEVWSHEGHADLPLAADAGRLVSASKSGLAAWNPDGSPAWEAPLDSPVTPPLVQDGWVLGASAKELLALRANDGSIVWRVPFDGARERPSIEGDSVYLSCEDGRVQALKLADGGPRWTQQLGAAATEVLPFPDRVFVGSADKYFYAIDAVSGEIAWRTWVGAPLRGKPGSDGERVFVVAFDNALHAYDRNSGVLRWSPGGVPFRPTAGPVVMAGLVFVAGPATEVRTFQAATGKPGDAVKLPQPLAALPAFTESDAGVAMAAITGNLTEQWTVTLWGPAPPAPAKGSPPISHSR
jgi:outer membrane protein assembly factor BamB